MQVHDGFELAGPSDSGSTQGLGALPPSKHGEYGSLLACAPYSLSVILNLDSLAS